MTSAATVLWFKPQEAEKAVDLRKDNDITTSQDTML